MKKVLTIVMAVLVTTCSFAQKLQSNKVPNVVKSSFQKAYPSVKEVKWSKEEDKFEASFEVNEVDQSVVINAEGKIVETEIAIKMSELPSNVTAYLKTNFAGQKIIETAKITDANGVIVFEVQIKKRDLIFDSKGNFVK
jgi:hypothetical protein